MSFPISLLSAARARKQLVVFPSGFEWSPVKVYRNGAGVYSTDYDPTPFLTEGNAGVTTYYVDADAGTSGNPGTAALPKNSLTSVTAGRVTKLLIKARGKFYVGGTGIIQTNHDNMCIEAWGGAPLIVTTETPPTVPFVWTDQGGGVWSAPQTFSGTNQIDPYLGTDPETLQKYPAVASLAICQATPGSYYRNTAGGVVLYVHTLDGSSPAIGHTLYGANESALSYAANKGTYTYDQRFAFHGVDFRGGVAAVNVTGDSVYNKRMDLVNCLLRHAFTKGVLGASGSTMVVSYGCIAGPSTYDGFAYHAAPDTNCPNAIEINCIGRNNGFVAAANQGSTTHDGGRVIRVNGQYYNNSDDQVADVGAGSESLNLGCNVVSVAGKAGFHAGNDASNTKVYLDGCTFSGTGYDVKSQMPSAAIFYRNMPAPNADPSGTGAIGTY